MVRVNSTFLNKPLDYVMDSVPHDNKFWQEWLDPVYPLSFFV